MNVEEFHERLRELYLPPEGQFTLVDVPAIRYAMIDGSGPPDGADLDQASKWLYSLVHLIKPFIRERMGKDYADPPLEYLFWADDPRDFMEGNRDRWKWRVMVVFVDWITRERYEDAAAVVETKLGPAPGNLRLEEFQEGRSVQIQHIGHYDRISEICDELYGEFLPGNGLKPNGYYHEIYLNDPRRTAPEKTRIVIRQPVAWR